MLLLALTLALPAYARDLASVGLGVQGAWSAAVGEGDVDALLATRLRWGLGSLGGAEVRMLADGRLHLSGIERLAPHLTE